jgi:hypothetical protein
VNWWAIDKDPAIEAVHRLGAKLSWVEQLDYLAVEDERMEQVKVVITNPPYETAMDFIEHTLEVIPNAHVAMLLRVNFAASAKRARIMRMFTPDVDVLPNRPSFSRSGTTDATEYGWFSWAPGAARRRSTGQFRVLATTNMKERKAR